MMSKWMRTAFVVFGVSILVAMAFARPAVSQQPQWIPTRPHKVVIRPQDTSRVLDDQSVQFDEDANWGDATVYFAFKKPTTIRKIRFELLPSKELGSQRLGSAGKRLLLFDVKPIREDRTGKRSYLQFSKCERLKFPDDDTLESCIDYLSDTGWVVPPLSKGASSHELIMQFGQAITFSSVQFFALEVDLGGGGPEFGILSRIRVSFVDPIVKPLKTTK